VLAPPPGVGSPAPRGGAPRSPRHPQMMSDIPLPPYLEVSAIVKPQITGRI